MGATEQDQLFAATEGYYTTKSLLALLRLGLLETAIEHGNVDVDQFAADNNCDARLLHSVLGYLVVRGYFEVDGERSYRLSEQGRSVAPYFGYLPMHVGAYEPIFGSLEDVLQGKLIYGENLKRAEHELVSGLSSMEERLLTQLSEIMADSRFNGVLDLGCGGARVLSNILLRDSNLQGVGIEWEEASCAEAERMLTVSGLQDRARIVRGDVGRISDLPQNQLQGVDLVIAMFVMHEIYFQRSRAEVVKCMADIADLLDGHGRLLMVEVSRIPEDQSRPGLRFVPEYQLVHDLSHQRLANEEDWRAMLAEAGLQVLRTEPAGMCEAFCFLSGPIRS